jgi:ubiquinone/menaquinone biosynthesis C-methylase UbiE
MLEQAGRAGQWYWIIGSGEDTLACEGCADLIFCGIYLHDFSDPQKVLENARRMIKLGGMLCSLDRQKKETPFGQPVSTRFDERTAATLIREAGFTVLYIAGISLVLPHHGDTGRKHYGKESSGRIRVEKILMKRNSCSSVFETVGGRR